MKLIRFATLAFGIFCLPVPASSQTAGTGFIQPCLASAADESPVYPTSVFPSAVGEIDVAFRLADGERYSRLQASWIAVDVGKAFPPNEVLGTTNLDLNPGNTTGVFRYQLDWFPPGRYRVDITADGRPWKSTELRVVPDVRGLRELSALMPLSKGMVWTYRFVQEAGEITKSAEPPPGATLDADGRVRATVTATLAKIDGEHARVSWARGGVPFSEEWWEFGHSGIAAVKRTATDESVIFDPPQIFFPWPVVMGSEWQYVSRDQSVRQSYRIWGPVPVKGPNGEAPGYIVLVVQKSPLAMTSVERDYLPGVGMVRSLAIAGFGTETVDREELVLTRVE